MCKGIAHKINWHQKVRIISSSQDHQSELTWTVWFVARASGAL